MFLKINGGEELDYSEITVTFDDIYGELPVPTKEGYIFIGWFCENNKNITSESIVRIANDHTLYAHWYENISNEESPTNTVVITFNTMDLNKEEIISVIKQYTNDDFSIVEFEDTLDGIKVIVKFNGIEDAIEFVECIKSTSQSKIKNLIKDVKYSFSNTGSFSPLFCPYVPLLFSFYRN